MTDEPHWKRVSSRYTVAEAALPLLLGTALCLLTLTVVPLVDARLVYPLVVSIGVATVLAAIAAPRRARAVSYAVRGNDVLLRRGLVVHQVTAVPFGRIQLVEITRGPLERMLGLAELRILTAATTSRVHIPGLIRSDAEELRDHVVAVVENRRSSR